MAASFIAWVIWQLVIPLIFHYITFVTKSQTSQSGNIETIPYNQYKENIPKEGKMYPMLANPNKGKPEALGHQLALFTDKASKLFDRFNMGKIVCN